MTYKDFNILAEAVRFELTDLFKSPVFKTGAIDHSATLPWVQIVAIKKRLGRCPACPVFQ